MSQGATAGRLRLRLPIVLSHVGLTTLGLAWTYPFLWMVSLALKDNRAIFTDPFSLLPPAPTLENFVRAWTIAGFNRYFVNSIVITLGTVLLTVLVVTLAGYAVGRYDFLGRRPLVALFAASLFVPPGYLIVPLFEVARGLGLLNNLLGVILAEAGSPQLAVFILLAAGYFSRLPNELAEAARIDGCGFFGLFFRVMLPLGMPIVVTICIMQTIYTWNAFLIPLVFTLTASHLRPLSVGMYAFRGEYTMDWTGMAAGAIIGIVPIVVVFLALQRYFINGVAGAVKG